MSHGHSRQTSLKGILTLLVCDSSFIYVVLAFREGLSLAMVGQVNTPMIVAIMAAMKDLAERTYQELTEIATQDNKGSQIISWYFLSTKNCYYYQ